MENFAADDAVATGQPSTGDLSGKAAQKRKRAEGDGGNGADDEVEVPRAKPGPKPKAKSSSSAASTPSGNYEGNISAASPALSVNAGGLGDETPQTPYHHHHHHSHTPTAEPKKYKKAKNWFAKEHKFEFQSKMSDPDVSFLHSWLDPLLYVGLISSRMTKSLKNC
jgi:hypothetical protein